MDLNLTTETVKTITEKPLTNNMEIWKFKVENIIEMPKEAKIITVQQQDSFNTCIWAIVDPEAEREKRMFSVIGTGEDFDPTKRKYIGTWKDSIFVWHLFEIIDFPIK